jgi:hypothetical protein
MFVILRYWKYSGEQEPRILYRGPQVGQFCAMAVVLQTFIEFGSGGALKLLVIASLKCSVLTLV